MKRLFFYLCCMAVLLVLWGCGVKEIKQQTFAAGQIGTIKGKVEVDGTQKGDIVVLHFEDEDGVLAFRRKTSTLENGEYEISAAAGFYYIAAFVDENGDDRYQQSEPAAFYGKPTRVKIAFNRIVTVKPIRITGPLATSVEQLDLVDQRYKAWKNIGQVVEFTDERFDAQYFGMGMWRPLDFLEQAEGGLFFLEDYDPGKIPVLFVHGVANGPTLWREVVENIDRDRFQPWLFYYPSGLRLEMISDYLAEAVLQLQKRYDFDSFYAVAHSMGGLVTRAFVKKYLERVKTGENRLQKVITINSPMDGMPSAASGVKYSPAIVPCWRDVDPASSFLKKIHDWQWPENIDYYLIVSFLGDEAGDGVVSLQSQARPGLQKEAHRMYLFQSEHTELIGRDDFFQLLNEILLQ